MLDNIYDNVPVTLNITIPSEGKLKVKRHSSSMPEVENYIHKKNDHIVIGNKKQDLMSLIKNHLSSEEQIDNKNSCVEDYIINLREQLGLLKNKVTLKDRKDLLKYLLLFVTKWMLQTENKTHKSNDLPAIQKPVRSQNSNTNLQHLNLIMAIIKERQSGTTETLRCFSLEHEELRAVRKRIHKFCISVSFHYSFYVGKILLIPFLVIIDGIKLDKL